MSILPLIHHDDAVLHLSRDPVMAGIMAQVGPLPVLTPTPDPFGTLVRSVNGQQLSVKAAAAIHARLVAHLGEVTAPALLAVSGEELRAQGLSWAKVRTVRALAEAAHTGAVDFEHLSTLADEEIVRELLPLPGIGRWTVEMFLMFALARPDVFSIGDLVLRQGLARLYPDIPGADVLSGWAPYRTLAARYIWADYTRLKSGLKAGGAPL